MNMAGREVKDMAENTYNVGIYCRLSNDDERDGESVSIENQKLMPNMTGSGCWRGSSV